MDKKNVCPWIKNSMSIQNSRCRLHQEIIEFYNYISPSEEEHNSRMKSFIELKELLEREIENTEIKEFGSFASKLYLPNNDIDLVVIHKELNSQKLMMKVANVLWSYPERYTEVELIKHAKVPIIKMKDQKHQYDFDIAFNQLDGVTHLAEVYKMLQVYPESKYLIMIIKCVLKQRKLNETYSGGVGSYLLFCMILAYLRENRRQLEKKNNLQELSNITLGDYLLGLFQFYSMEFNEKEQYIEMLNGGSIKRKHNSQDSAFSLYSPQEDSHDIGNAAFRIRDVFSFFKNRYTFVINYNYQVNESILKYIVNPSSMVFDFFNNQFRKVH